uniref:Uncharacterized protein n=1 Tax=viral metagenome TaxID=1070528 RepID=A0A6C0DIM2_9ZZZZ
MSIPVGLFKDADVAGPLSPENPWFPVPAIVVIIPELFILRILLLSVSAIYTFPDISTATSFG